METIVYNQAGEKVGTTLLPEEIFGVKMNSDLVYQIATSSRANRRQGTAHAKDRGEVSGGGKKPWRQKGTGRARHGSIRSPLWKGGGVTFGPRHEKVMGKEMPKKMKRAAMLMVLSEKVRGEKVFILDKLVLDAPKTKLMASAIGAWRKKIEKFKRGNALVAIEKKDDKIVKASRNIPEVKVMEARELNALDLLSFPYLFLTQDSLEVLKETFLNK
jgi:large subunit ribosomal protein L4